MVSGQAHSSLKSDLTPSHVGGPQWTSHNTTDAETAACQDPITLLRRYSICRRKSPRTAPLWFSHLAEVCADPESCDIFPRPPDTDRAYRRARSNDTERRSRRSVCSDSDRLEFLPVSPPPRSSAHGPVSPDGRERTGRRIRMGSGQCGHGSGPAGLPRYRSRCGVQRPPHWSCPVPAGGGRVRLARR